MSSEEDLDELIESALTVFPELASCQDPEEQVRILSKYIALQQSQDSSKPSKLLMMRPTSATITGSSPPNNMQIDYDVFTQRDTSTDFVVSGGNQHKLFAFMDTAIRKALALGIHMQSSVWNESIEHDCDLADINYEFKVENKKVTAQGFAPNEFKIIRCLLKVEDEQLIRSICLSGKLSGGYSSGKSGSLMFVSPDKKFVLKAISAPELKVLQEDFLKEYVRHISQYPNTLLPRFFGAFRITTPNDTYRFIIMNNVFSPENRVDVIYDLKGSRLGRAATMDEKKSNRVIVQKDLDFEENRRSLLLDRTTQLCFELQLETDAHFLEKLNVMDYSLLVGIHFISPLTSSELTSTSDESVFRRECWGVRSRLPDGSPLLEIYYLGIIDVLQQFNFTKAVESSVKSLAYDKQEISSVNAAMYSRRFVDFIKRGIGPPPSSSS
jgi:hypothetical protein